MSDSLGFALVIFFGNILPAAILLYAAYWAFAIRRALVSHIYRSQALWLGAICIYLAASGPLGIPSNNPIVSIAMTVSVGLAFLFIFAWIDSTIRVARRSDPLLRSPLQWERLRVVLWPVLVLLIAPSVYPSTSIFPAIGLLSVLGITGVTTVALLIGAIRSRDSALRGAMKWIGVFLLCELGNFIFGGLTTSSSTSGVLTYLDYSFPDVPSAIIVIIGFYALYKSARSLAPINRLSLEVVPKAELPSP
jgi:hypothetical protein